MPAPDLNPIAAWLYEQVSPFAYADEENGWALAHWCEAWTRSIIDVVEMVIDTDDGPGWSSLFDADRVPEIGAGFLAQIVGVTPVQGEALADARQRIKTAAGHRRGSPQSLINEIKLVLTGTKSVTLIEREGGHAYRAKVGTIPTEVPDDDAVDLAITRQKPAGIKVTRITTSDLTYDDLAAAFTTYNDLASGFGDYNDIID